MSNKNQRIYSDDPEVLKRVKDEQDNYIGRECSIDFANGVVTIYALPRRHQKSRHEHKDRDKRSEKFERRG